MVSSNERRIRWLEWRVMPFSWKISIYFHRAMKYTDDVNLLIVRQQIRNSVVSVEQYTNLTFWFRTVPVTYLRIFPK